MAYIGRYHVYKNETYLGEMTTNEITKMADCTVSAIYKASTDGYRIKGIYKIIPTLKKQEAKKGEWFETFAEEWDRVRLRLNPNATQE